MDVLADAGADGLVGYANLGPVCGAVVSAGRAELIQLQTVYGLEDAYNLLELVTVDAHNRRVMQRRRDKDDD